MVVHDVELFVIERREIAHVALHETKLRPAFSRESAHRRELALRDVEERRGGAQLREEDGVPSAATGEGQHALSVELDAAEPSARQIVEKTPLTASVARGSADGPCVRDAGLRKALPHLTVVLADVIECGAPRQGTSSQHWFRCALRKRLTRASSYVVSSSIQFHAVSAIVPAGILSYGRISSFTSPYLSLG